LKRFIVLQDWIKNRLAVESRECPLLFSCYGRKADIQILE